MNKSRTKIDFINKENVLISNRSHLLKTIENMRKDGPSKLHVISDFDWTITKYENLDGKSNSSYDILIFSDQVSDEVKDEYIKCGEYYLPYYLNINEPTRKEKMIEYWNRINDLSIKANLSKTSLKKVIANTRVRLRDNTNDFFVKLNSNKVPLSIISAGIGNVVTELLRTQSKIYPNTKITANFIEFSSDEHPVKFKGETIHMFNKNEAIKFDQEFSSSIQSRTNIILFGDSEGDEKIADNIENVSNILKIGFLNKIDETKLEKYKKIFDIVLINDMTFNIPNEILDNILSDH